MYCSKSLLSASSDQEKCHGSQSMDLRQRPVGFFSVRKLSLLVAGLTLKA